MKNVDSLIRTLLFALFVAGGIGFSSCTENATQFDEGFALYYPGISEISPSTHINITPTWYGGTPVNFAIVSVRLDGTIFQTDCFSVDPETGVFSVTHSDQLPIGLYTIDIVCEFNGSRYEFPAAIEINMMKPIPDGIIVVPPSLSVKLSDILSTGQQTELPTAQITTDGSNHVEIKKYLIANVYRKGELVNDCLPWFSMSSDGQFSIVPNNSDFEAGIYTFDFKLTTYIVGTSSEEGIFKDALTLDVTSEPTRITYQPNSTRVEQGYSIQSPAPAIKGSLEGLTYAIQSVDPDNAVGISVDPNTGVLTFPVTDQSVIGQTYTVSLTVGNDYGSAEFEDVFSFTVIDFIEPITAFAYDDIDENISGVSITNPVQTIDGDEVTYSFVDLPDALSDLQIDPQTGTVTCAKGVELSVGVYTVTVLAANIKSSMQATFTINVVANPNYFTYVRWGNNLGLTPIEQYANQFRIYKETSKLTFPVVESDIAQGRPVAYGNLQNKTGWTHSTSINATTGVVTVFSRSQIYAHCITVDVTVGGDSEAAITRTFPIFIDQCGVEAAGYMIEYTPFAFHVNPKSGGSSVEPKISAADGTPHTGASLDFRTNARYGNLFGPPEHIEGLLKNDKTVFLKTVWDKYYTALGKSVGYTNRAPMSYYDNVSNGFLNATGGYVDPKNLKVVINPEKFVDDYGYADGVFVMAMYFNAAGGDPHTTAGSQEVNRIVIWLDPNYTE